MKDYLIKLLKRKQLADMIYISKSNEITQRRVKILKVDENSFKAYCFVKREVRVFLLENVLSLFPVSYGREVG